ARRGALSQQLNAIESLASVDTLCLDKTGTLTGSDLAVLGVVPAEGVSPEALREALARFAAATPDRNLPITALARALPAPYEAPGDVVPFSSARRWSGLRLGDTSYVLAAPELLALGDLREDAATRQEAGRRIVAIATTTTRFPENPDEGPPPAVPLGLAVLAEELRPDAKDTIAFLVEQGIDLKVLSGAAPETVGSIAADAGIQFDAPVDGRSLPVDPSQLDGDVLGAAVIGRISPDGKRAVVEALTARGRYVAMV